LTLKGGLHRGIACAILLAVWAAIYLPGLGAVEIKGEEIRRIMPGITMLQTGNWIVPHYNGVAYLRKPPLVNWAIALSVKELGARTEWTVRLPSVLAMLAMGLTMVLACGPWLGTEAALGAALIALTCAGIVEKGRLAEIEAIYIALFGMAFSCWLGWTAMGRSRWLTWTATGLLLGLGLLAKGPPDLAFFYAIAGFIAWQSRRRKEVLNSGLASWAHLWGILLMLAVFACWCVPYYMRHTTAGAGGVWARQMEQRVGGGSGATVFANFARSLVNFLPWILGLPLFWRRSTLARLDARDRLLVEASRWPIVICAFALMFIPGMLPRYTLPLVIPYALLLALLLKTMLPPLRLPLAAGCIVGAGMLVFGLCFGRRVAAHGTAREFAAQINAVKPAETPLYIYNPGVQPEVFYIHGPVLYPDGVKVLPQDVPYLLAPASNEKSLEEHFAVSRVLAQPRDQGGKRFVLLSLEGHKHRGGRDHGPKTAAPGIESPRK
jgi:4-amino-4-deoxy-L-arabinose transferase-like glycosyltransferase